VCPGPYDGLRFDLSVFLDKVLWYVSPIGLSTLVALQKTKNEGRRNKHGLAPDSLSADCGENASYCSVNIEGALLTGQKVMTLGGMMSGREVEGSE